MAEEIRRTDGKTRAEYNAQKVSERFIEKGLNINIAKSPAGVLSTIVFVPSELSPQQIGIKKAGYNDIIGNFYFNDEGLPAQGNQAFELPDVFVIQDPDNKKHPDNAVSRYQLSRWEIELETGETFRIVPTQYNQNNFQLLREDADGNVGHICMELLFTQDPLDTDVLIPEGWMPG